MMSEPEVRFVLLGLGILAVWLLILCVKDC